jgi:hypothetical protein
VLVEGGRNGREFTANHCRRPLPCASLRFSIFATPDERTLQPHPEAAEYRPFFLPRQMRGHHRALHEYCPFLHMHPPLFRPPLSLRHKHSPPPPTHPPPNPNLYFKDAMAITDAVTN